VRAANPSLCRGIVLSFIKLCERFHGPDAAVVRQLLWGKGLTTVDAHLAEHCSGADALQLTLRFSFRTRLTAGVGLLRAALLSGVAQRTSRP
jgi:hypothetical protein